MSQPNGCRSTRPAMIRIAIALVLGYIHISIILETVCCVEIEVVLDGGGTLTCDPDADGYPGNACESELLNIKHGDKAFFPVSGERSLIEDVDLNRLPKHNCVICVEIEAFHVKNKSPSFDTLPYNSTAAIGAVSDTENSPKLREALRSLQDHIYCKYSKSLEQMNLIAYGLFAFVLFAFGLTATFKAYVSFRNISFLLCWRKAHLALVVAAMLFLLHWSWRPTSQSSCSKFNMLLVDDAALLLELAGTEKDVWNAFAMVTLARRILHGAQPEEQFIREDGLLFKAIIQYDIILGRVSALETPGPLSDSYLLSSCPANLDKRYADITANSLEPIFGDSRNLAWHEMNLLVSLLPYKILPSFGSVRSRKYGRKILVDVGASYFHASSKYLLDMYSPFMKFDELHMFEGRVPEGGMGIPLYYEKEYDISMNEGYVNVGSRDSGDIVSWLVNNTEMNDFVALKFDVDHGNDGLTMEWGFLSDLVHSEAIGLVDELFIELHFRHSKIAWTYPQHSMKQAYEVLQELRRCGLAVHAWP